jgi:hypothetical protein
MPTKSNFFKKSFSAYFSAYYFLKVHNTYTSFYKDKKSKRSHKAVGRKALLTVFAWWRRIRIREAQNIHFFLMELKLSCVALGSSDILIFISI